MQNDLFSSTETAPEWPEHTVPARLDASEAGREAAGSARKRGLEPVGFLAARAGAREVIIQRSAPDAPHAGGMPPMRDTGDIRGFSDSSRTRMRQTLQRLKQSTGGLFVTLTYHESNPTGREVKRHLHAFVQALRRRWDGLRWSMVWRLEYQKRGAPHLHLLIARVRFEHKEWVKATWHRITGEVSDSHAAMGAWVERWPPGRKLSSYVAKYMAKDGGVPAGWQGRIWGVRNRKHLPEVPVNLVYRIPYGVALDAALGVWAAWGMDNDKPCPYSLRIWTEDPIGTVHRLLDQYDTERAAIPGGGGEWVERGQG